MSPLTISGCPTENALEPPPTVNKHHVRVHVGLTSLAPDRTRLPEVYYWRIILQCTGLKVHTGKYILKCTGLKVHTEMYRIKSTY